MQKTVHDILLREQLITHGEVVLVAVSGGIDSVVLLHLLHSLAPHFPFTLHAVHLDHAIRPESVEDAEFVATLCARLAVPLTSERVDVPTLAAERGEGLEATGRSVRREFFRRVAAEQGSRTIALGHHRDDQAETVVHRLLRGSGASGLAGMRMRHGEFIRPLLKVSRTDIAAYATEHQLSWREDLSNTDTRFTRNRIRHQLLPQMREFNPQIDVHLTALAERLASEEDFWSELVEQHFAELLVDQDDDDDGLRLSVAGLQAQHPALRNRILRHALCELRGSAMELAATQIDALNGLLNGASQAEVHLTGAWAARRYATLWLRREAPVVTPFELSVTGPGTIELPDGGSLNFSYTLPQGEGRQSIELDAEAVSFPLRVRTFLSGDRFRPQGGPGSRKLKDVFIDAKIERERRRSWPLLVGEEILWIPGLRRCAGYHPPASAKQVLRVVFKADFHRD